MKNETSSELSEWSEIHRRWQIAMAPPRIPEKKHQARDAAMILDELITTAPGRPIFPLDRYITAEHGNFRIPALSAAEVYGKDYNPDDWE